MHTNPSPPNIDADSLWASNLCSLRLEELVDLSNWPDPWPVGLPGPNSTESSLLPLATSVVAHVDDLAAAVFRDSTLRFSQVSHLLVATVDGCPELAALAARRLRRLTLSLQPVGAGRSLQMTPSVKDALATLLANLDAARTRDGHDPRPLALSHEAGSATPSPRLSARELQVARYVSMGMTNKQIAIALKLSPNTIKRHIARILRRLGLCKRSAVATWYAVQPRSSIPAPLDRASPGPSRAPPVSLQSPSQVSQLRDATCHQ